MESLFAPVLSRVEALLKTTPRALVAIDGRSASGKTTLAALLGRTFPCTVLHMDDYYLPPAQRPPRWREIPAGNMDLSRLRDEALVPAGLGQEILSRPYDCQTGRFSGPFHLSHTPLTVIEGSYSLHPSLRKFYDFTVFLTCSKSVQEARLRARAPEKVNTFLNLWVPLEERYFASCEVSRAASLVLNTSGEETP